MLVKSTGMVQESCVNQDTANPYQTPEQLTPPPKSRVVEIVGDCLLVPRDYEFPPICFKTGDTEDLSPPITKQLAWYHPAWVLLLLLNLFIFIIVVLCIQKRGKVTFYLTREQRRRHRRRVLINWLFFLTCIPLFYGAIMLPDYAVYFSLTGAVAILTSLILAATWTRMVAPRRIDEHWIHFRFKDPELLQRLYATCAAAHGTDTL